MARGTIGRRKGSGNYFIRYYDSDGKQQWETIGPRKKDAERALAERLRQVNTGEFIKVEDITFSELCDKWLELKEGQIRPKTLAAYRPIVERLCTHFGRYKVRAISQEMVEQFAAKLTKEHHPATTIKTLTLLKNVFRKAMEWNYAPRNPAEFVRKPRLPKPDVEFLEPAEIMRLIEETDPKHRCLIMFACLTGCRQSEILALSWGDVDLASGRVFIRKTLQGGKFYEPKTESSKRVIDIPPVLIAELKTHQARQAVELPQNIHELVFTTSSGTPLDGRNVTQRILEPALKRAGLRKVGFHSLRHSYVSMLVAQGENVKTIQSLVGHSDAKTTWGVYSHLFNGATRDAVHRLQDTLFSESKENLNKNFTLG